MLANVAHYEKWMVHYGFSGELKLGSSIIGELPWRFITTSTLLPVLCATKQYDGYIVSINARM